MENTSQGASGPGNSLYRFFKRVPNVEELCERPVPTHLLPGEALGSWAMRFQDTAASALTHGKYLLQVNMVF